MKLKVFSADGSTSADKDFPVREFEGNKGLAALKQVILAYRANARQGTHSTLTNSTVSGTGKKPFRQKGSGIARQGARNRSQHYHGAVSHGPQPRDYTQKISKKLKRLALQRALFDRAVSGEVDVIEKFEVEAPKTKLIDSVIKNISNTGKKILVVDDSWTENAILAARNIKRLIISEAKDVNALDLSLYDRVIISEQAMNTVLARANGGN